MAKTERMLVGRQGEEVACTYLRGKGYVVYARNVRIGHGEIDLICYEKAARCIVFVEVKTHSHSYRSFSPADNMRYRKRKNLYRSMWRWIIAHDYEGFARTDVVYVVGKTVVEHRERIF